MLICSFYKEMLRSHQTNAIQQPFKSLLPFLLQSLWMEQVGMFFLIFMEFSFAWVPFCIALFKIASSTLLLNFKLLLVAKNINKSRVCLI